MKKKLLFAFIIISISTSAQTSVYHPFPDSGAVWIMNWQHWCTNSSIGCLSACNSNFQYRVDGDTLISGNTYKKIIKDSYLQYCSCTVISPPNPWSTPSCTQYPFNSNYYGGIRNDSVNKKVYFIGIGNPVEDVLYDFNLNVGDTLQTPICNKAVVKIDSVLIGSDYRKCYWLDTTSGYDDRIIEGIGHVGNLFGGPFDGCWPCVCDFAWAFSCFRQNGNVLYGNSSCALVTSVDQIVPEKSSIIISPNPITNELRIQNAELKIETVEIYNVPGEKIFSRQPTANSQQQFIVDVSFLKAGIYFLQLKTNSGVKSAKFVKSAGF